MVECVCLKMFAHPYEPKSSHSVYFSHSCALPWQLLDLLWVFLSICLLSLLLLQTEYSIIKPFLWRCAHPVAFADPFKFSSQSYWTLIWCDIISLAPTGEIRSRSYSLPLNTMLLTKSKSDFNQQCWIIIVGTAVSPRAEDQGNNISKLAVLTVLTLVCHTRWNMCLVSLIYSTFSSSI